MVAESTNLDRGVKTRGTDRAQQTRVDAGTADFK